ncbi:Phospholipid-transporting ATPase 1 [Hordeum vulgare]|nr:Phospholipid-transporting ATPase 1 [Hordeum vulgare]
MQPIPGFRVYPQGNRFSEECLPDVSIVAPFTLALGTIHLNIVLSAGRSSSRGMRKRPRKMSGDMLTGARNLLDGMPAAVDNDMTNHFFDIMISEGGAPAARAYYPDETQSEDGRSPFTQTTNDPHGAFMQDQVSLDGFSLDHEFLEDYGLEEEEDDMDIDGEPLFEDKLSKQTGAVMKPKRKSKQMKAYTPAEDKLLCECWRDIGQDPKVFQALDAFKVKHDGKSYHLAHCWTIINGEDKFKAPYAALLARWGKEVVQDQGDGEKARPEGNTNSKKEDKRDAASIALLEKVEGMISKKYLREEKRRQEKLEKMHAFMEIQRRRLEMDAERQARMLELEEAKQAKMLEIEATNAKTKAK